MTTAKTTVPKTARKRKPRPDWWPKRITVAEFEELDRDYGGLCLACGELAYSDCEPDMRNALCEACDENRLHGAAEARLMGALVVEDSGGTAEPVAPPPEPAAALPAPAGTVRAQGLLAHHFHGVYSASLVLMFESTSNAAVALATLGGPWQVSDRNGCVLRCTVDTDALKALETQLGGFGADVAKIASLRKSVDHGEPFTVDVPVGGSGGDSGGQEAP